MSKRHTASEREKDLARVEKHCTSVDVKLAAEHLSRNLLANMLSLFSRAQLLRERANQRSCLLAMRLDMLLETVRIPICFVRRCAFTDDECDDKSVYTKTGKVLRFDASEKACNRPLLSQTNMLVDSAPPDLYAGAHEVRYLTILELAVLAAHSVGRIHLSDARIASSRTFKHTKEHAAADMDALLFDAAVDVPIENFNDASDAARREFTRQLDHLRVEKLLMPFEHRLPIVTRAKQVLDGFDFQQSSCRAFTVGIEKSNDLKHNEQKSNNHNDNTNENEKQAQNYRANIQFRLEYLHLRTIESGHLGRSRSIQIPAKIFADEYNDRRWRKFESSDIAQIENVLQLRLAYALERFGKSPKCEEELQELFGDAQRMAKFDALVQWKTKFHSRVSNQRACAQILLDALHNYFDDIELATLDKFEFDRLFPLETRSWDYMPQCKNKRNHERLFSFVSSCDSSYNEWKFDKDRSGETRGMARMMAPADIAEQFYKKHWEPAFQKSKFNAKFAAKSKSEKEFWRTWARESAPKSFAQILAFEFDLIDCIDPSAGNDYGSIFEPQKRKNLAYNPFANFASSVFNYVALERQQDRFETQQNLPDAAIYVETVLSRQCLDIMLPYINAAIEDEMQNGSRDLATEWKSNVESLQERLRSFGLHVSWADVQNTMHLNTSRTIGSFVCAWHEVELMNMRAAMFDRGTEAFDRPFSTLYDFGVHCALSNRIECYTDRKIMNSNQVQKTNEFDAIGSIDKKTEPVVQNVASKTTICLPPQVTASMRKPSLSKMYREISNGDFNQPLQRKRKRKATQILNCDA